MRKPEKSPEASYSPGTWAAVAGANAWLLADVAATETVVQRCWALIRAEAGGDDVVGAIAHEGFRTVGSFALATYANGQGRLVVRGAATAEAVTASGEVTVVRAEGVATWVDRQLEPSVAQIRLAAPDSSDAAALPLSSGVTLRGCHPHSDRSGTVYVSIRLVRSTTAASPPTGEGTCTSAGPSTT